MKKENILIKLKHAVIVEGKYDKIKLKSILDAVIITVDGFGIYKNKEKTQLIRSLAESCGIVILTDSDTAGFKIRNHLKGCIKSGEVINVYIPRIKGKEKRKEKPSSEGLLGVEGIDTKTLEETFIKLGLAVNSPSKPDFLTGIRMFDDGLTGMANSSVLRRRLLCELGLPPLLGKNSMLEVINRLFTEEQYQNALKNAKATPHKDCASDAQSIFLSDETKSGVNT